MKKFKKTKLLKELAHQFEIELNSSLPISITNNGSILYKDYFIKKEANQSYSLYNQAKDLIGNFFLRSCALIAAKSWDSANMRKFNEIKELDVKYWANYSNINMCKNSMKKNTSLDRYIILLNKLELSRSRLDQVKDEISKQFTWNFV